MIEEITALYWIHSVDNIENTKRMGEFIQDNLEGMEGILFYESPKILKKNYFNIDFEYVINEFLKGKREVNFGIFFENSIPIEKIFKEECTFPVFAKLMTALFEPLIYSNLKVHCVDIDLIEIEMPPYKKRNKVMAENIKSNIQLNDYSNEKNKFFGVFGKAHRTDMSPRLKKISKNVKEKEF